MFSSKNTRPSPPSRRTSAANGAAPSPVQCDVSTYCTDTAVSSNSSSKEMMGLKDTRPFLPFGLAGDDMASKVASMTSGEGFAAAAAAAASAAAFSASPPLPPPLSPLAGGLSGSSAGGSGAGRTPGGAWPALHMSTTPCTPPLSSSRIPATLARIWAAKVSSFATSFRTPSSPSLVFSVGISISYNTTTPPVSTDSVVCLALYSVRKLETRSGSPRKTRSRICSARAAPSKA
mmetsp:Transcript_18678/g.40271  ORF Transcript_18678/g.40271 Transcript_18678/m.40271 type:complete len:233 (-) Transcript_18678:12-710(-)